MLVWRKVSVQMMSSISLIDGHENYDSCLSYDCDHGPYVQDKCGFFLVDIDLVPDFTQQYAFQMHLLNRALT